MIGISALPQFQNVSRIAPDEDGLYLMDDMYLNPFQFSRFTDDPAVHALTRQAIKPRTDRWPAGEGVKGEMPYLFAEPYDSGHKKRIEDAIADFNEMLSGCLRIR